MKQLRPAIFSVLAFTILTGLVFPLAITAISQAAMPFQANGSLISQNGKPVGSALLGQGFSSPRYFHSRPSAAGDGYDASASSGTNLGATSDKLINGAQDFDGVKQLAAKYRRENGLAPDAKVPVDAVTRSGSGLDPHISPQNARLQAPRVARERGLSLENVKLLIEANTQRAPLGILGDDGVHVLNLNRALDAL